MENIILKNFFHPSYFLPKLNNLSNNFPKLDPDDVNNFLEEDENHIEMFDYILRSLYPILIKMNSENSLKSIQKISDLLNSIYDDSLLFLWKVKIKNYPEWNGNQEFVSYFSLLNERRILGLIIYSMFLHKNKDYSILSEEELLRVSSSLLIFLSDETISTILEDEEFQILIRKMESIFSKDELIIFLKKKPNLFEIQNFSNSNNLYYQASLQRSEMADIESIINFIELDAIKYEETIKYFPNDFSGKFIFDGTSIRLKLSYLIELIKMFHSERHLLFLEKLSENPATKNLIRKYDKETAISLINSNFKFIDEFHEFKKSLAVH